MARPAAVGVLDAAEVFGHRFVRAFALVVLFFENFRRGAGVTCKKEQQVIFKIVTRLLGKFQRPRFDPAARNALRSRFFEEAVQFQLPRDFQLADEVPRLVTFELLPLEEPVPRLGDPP